MIPQSFALRSAQPDWFASVRADSAFPFFIALDRQSRILAISHPLRRLEPTLALGTVPPINILRGSERIALSWGIASAMPSSFLVSLGASVAVARAVATTDDHLLIVLSPSLDRIRAIPVAEFRTFPPGDRTADVVTAFASVDLESRSRNAAQVAAVRTAKLLRVALDVASDGFITLDATGRITSFVGRCESIAAKLFADSHGERLDLAFPADTGEMIVDAWQAATDMNPQNLVVDMIRNDEPASLSLTFIRSQLGDPANVTMVVIRDRTVEAVATRALVEAIEESRHAALVKDEFVANMSHELRTPLNSILGLGEVLGEQLVGPLNTEQRECIDQIDVSAKHLLSVLNDVLELARSSHAHSEPVITTFAVSETIESVVRMCMPQAVRGRLSIRVDSNANVEMSSDERRVKQALLNLVGNAIKFTPPGGRITLSSWVGADGCLAIDVTDTGVGVPANELTNIFEPFYQVSRGASRSSGGTGLGLAIARRMLASVGGTVSVTSEVGHGTTFRVTLPTSERLWQPRGGS